MHGSFPVDSDDALGKEARQLAVAVVDEAEEGDPLPLDPVARGGRASARLVHVDEEEERHVGEDPADRLDVEAEHAVDAQPTGDALIGERGVEKAIAHDVGSSRQRRPDDVIDELGPGGGEERRLGPRCHRLAAEEQLAHALADRRTAGLSRGDDLPAFAFEPVPKHVGLRRLPRAVDAFESHEHGREDSDAPKAKKASAVEPPVQAEVLVRPWRTATLIASAVAAVELVVILVLGVVLVGKPLTQKMRDVARSRTLGVPAAEPAQKPKIGPSVPRLARGDTTVMILNGNGVSGAAHAAASRVRSRGYSIGEVGNAERTDYMRSVVMYRPGFRGEALRLARDLRIGIVGPLDGLTVRELMGAHLAVIVA